MTEREERAIAVLTSRGPEGCANEDGRLVAAVHGHAVRCSEGRKQSGERVRLHSMYAREVRASVSVLDATERAQFCAEVLDGEG